MSSIILCGYLVGWFTPANAHFGVVPPPLTGVTPPPVPGLLDGPDPIIRDQQAAIALGKALFWDMNVGSDGMACASCHFHAGADNRFKNQLNPGVKSSAPTGQSFEPLPSGGGGANYTVTLSDFPFFQFSDPLQGGTVTFSTDDVMSSAGTFSGDFQTAPRIGSGNDSCLRQVDPVFHVGTTGTRRVEPRNTPTVINAVFNHRNFWDGRANNVFNGSSPWGDRDPDAGVWVKVNGRTVQKQRLHLINSSLASQAVAPPVSDAEMACRHRIFPDLGRKLLNRHPLDHQKVHWNDSVLGPLSLSSPGNLQPGLNTTYQRLIQKAFNPKYWSYRRRGPMGRPLRDLPYSQTEANFAMFFGLAIQLYESTLISDDAPYDRAFTAGTDSVGNPLGLSPSERNGLNQFRIAHCNTCHVGPTLTSAAIATNAAIFEADPTAYGPFNNQLAITRNGVNRDFFFNIGRALHDTGFVHTGVLDPIHDPGVGGTDPFGNPLSFAEQYARKLAGQTSVVVDTPVNQIRSCDFLQALAVNGLPSADTFGVPNVIPDPHKGTASCYRPNNGYLPTQAAAASEISLGDHGKIKWATAGAMKIPTLRNVELTGPYMHNGSMATLEQVIEFYTRGGNLQSGNPHANIFLQSELIFGTFDNTGTLIHTGAENRADLVAFLKSLTDDRVRFEQAPFDHPELMVPNGHVGNEFAATPGSPLDPDLAQDEFLVLPAVGATGSTVPLQPFETQLAP